MGAGLTREVCQRRCEANAGNVREEKAAYEGRRLLPKCYRFPQIRTQIVLYLFSDACRWGPEVLCWTSVQTLPEKFDN
jgi:hypothetical protein